MKTLTDLARFYTLTELARYLKISVPTLWRWRKANRSFPKPFKPTTQTILFDKAEVEIWLDESRDA